MNKFLTTFPAIALLAILFIGVSQNSYANVLVTDGNIAVNGDDITSGIIVSGDGEGDYELVFCGIQSDGANPFNPPTPGAWNELFFDVCDGPNCQLGIWGRIPTSSTMEDITCSWANSSEAFVAATIRFNGVDRDNPIIDMACSEQEGNTFVVRPVSSLPGAQIVFVQLFNIQGTATSNEADFDDIGGTFVSSVHYQVDPNRVLALQGSSQFDEDGEGFAGFVLPRPTDIFDTKVCVISLRMGTRNVPALSEWGLISFAALAGIAGIWYLRRRKAAV